MRTVKVLPFIVLLFLSTFSPTISFSQQENQIARKTLGLIYLENTISIKDKKLEKYWKELDFASIVKEYGNKTDDESILFSGLAWMHLLNYSKANEYFSKIKTREYLPIAKLLKIRTEAFLKNDIKLAQQWLSEISHFKNSMTLSEKAFVLSYFENKPLLDDLREAYKTAIDEYKRKEVDLIDIQAFNYLVYLFRSNIDEALREINRLVTYDFSKNTTVLYYSAEDLQLASFSVIRLLAEVLKTRGTRVLEITFHMSVDDFIQLDDTKRKELVLRTYVNDKGNYNTMLYYLKSSLDVLILGKNDFYFVQTFKEPSMFFKTSVYDLTEMVRRLLIYTKVN